MAGEEHPCIFCRKKFSTLSSLNIHLRVHTGERPFQCDLCGKRYKRNSHLIRHKNTHTGVKPFQCNVCKKCFSEKHILKAHKIVHSGEKPFLCEICTKAFSFKSSLRQHLRFHAGSKPYKCPHCSKSFSQSGHLNTHKKRVHLLTALLAHQKKSHSSAEKNVKCEDCRMKIYPESNPVSGSGTSLYSCKLCGTDFQNISALHTHMKQHLGEMAGKCMACVDVFLAKIRAPESDKFLPADQMTECLFCEKWGPQRDLEEHMKMHTGE